MEIFILICVILLGLTGFIWLAIRQKALEVKELEDLRNIQNKTAWRVKTIHDDNHLLVNSDQQICLTIRNSVYGTSHSPLEAYQFISELQARNHLQKYLLLKNINLD